MVLETQRATRVGSHESQNGINKLEKKVSDAKEPRRRRILNMIP